MSRIAYSNKYCELVIKLMSEGASIEEVASDIGVTKQTIYNWSKKDEEFFDAIELGREMSKAWWLKQGRIALREKDFSPQLFYMNMKNRYKWKDRHDHTSNDKQLPTPIISLNTTDDNED